MPDHILVTGGCGFIGSHVVEHLLATTDARITVLDGLTYAGDVGRLAQLEGYDPARVKIEWHDLRSPIAPSLAARLGNPNIVYHLAAQSHVDRSIEHPAEFIIGNNAATVHLYDWLRSLPRTDGHYLEPARLDHVVHVSTDEVYGPAPDELRSVEWDAIIPSNPYSASKAGCEATAIAYWRTYGLPITIVNIMNVIGRRQHGEKFMPRTVRAIRAGAPVTIHARRVKPLRFGQSSETQLATTVDEGGVWQPSTRVWIHADDVARALTFITDQLDPALYPGADRPSRWHIAGTDEVDVATMAQWIAEDLGAQLELEFVDYHSSRPGHDHRYALDASKLTKCGWKPELTTREAVAAVVAWHIDHEGWM